MAAAGEDDVEYESDPEEAKQSLVMRRRRAASDDEDSEEERGEERERERESQGPEGVTGIHSDESDDQGAAADYDDEDEEYLEEEEEDAYNEEEELIDDVGVRGQDVRGVDDADRVSQEKKMPVPGVSENAAEEFGDAPADGQMNPEGEKKVNEPFAVPTAGAFYMHDDRFRDNAAGRNRRTFGGRRLWESRDERKWGHDKFEEMSVQERHYDERRRGSRGQARGRGRGRGIDRAYGRGNRSRALDNHSTSGAATDNNSNSNHSNNNNNNSNQTPVPRAVRGRGPRRYDHSLRKSNQGPPNQNKLSTKSVDSSQHGNSAQTFVTASNFESDSALGRKNAFGSSLSSASPPFYPSGSSNKEGGLSQKKNVQTGDFNRNNRPPPVSDTFSGAPSNSLLRGKNVSNSIGMEKLSMNDHATSFSGKPFSPVQAAASVSASIGSSHPSHGRTQGRGTGQMSYQSAFPQGQVSKASSPLQAHSGHRGPVPNRVQPSGQQLGQRPGSGSQASSPPRTAVSVNSYDTGESDTPSESSKSKGTLVAKGKGSTQGSGRGTFIYGGAHVMGAGGPMGVGRGDQNFPTTPAFLPVMQFGGQHPGGMGVPAVGMAFPGYVAQPQLGLGSSEMTWLPVLAGAAGAMGATYPYITVDGSYHASQPGQTTAAGSTSKESSTNKPNTEAKPPQGTEAVNEEQGQRQNKARRYSEMNFGQ